MKKSAFTLAEVLITLGIIGIVAALTLPTLIHNNHKKEVETKLKKFYSTMNQAIMLSEVENGDKKYWWEEPLISSVCSPGNSYSEECLRLFYETYLKKYLKNVDSVKYVKRQNKNNALQINFADGSAAFMLFEGRDWLFGLHATKLKKSDDSLYGTETFLFGFYPDKTPWGRYEHFSNKGIEPYITGSWDGTRDGLKGNPENYAKLIQLNNWEIPDDYPLKI